MSRPLQLQPKVLVMLGVGPGTYLILTADAWVSGSVLAPQKFLLSQEFRHLMKCKKYLENFFLPCLVSEIQLFVYIFGQNSKWTPEVRKGALVKYFCNRKIQKTWLVTLFGPLVAILKFAQKCKQRAVSQKLSKIKNFFKDIFCISWGT